MRKLYVLALCAVAALGCQPGPDGESFIITPEMEEAARVIEELEKGERDAALVGTWEGLAATEERLDFAADGKFEAQSSERAVGQGYWATKEGALNFIYFKDEAEGAALQTCEFEIGRDGHLSIKPDHNTRSGSGEFRKLKIGQEGRVYEHEGKDWRPDFLADKEREVEYVDVHGMRSSSIGHDPDGDAWTLVTCDFVTIGFSDGTRETFRDRTVVFDNGTGNVAAIRE
jgi:hypothetical protein